MNNNITPLQSKRVEISHGNGKENQLVLRFQDFNFNSIQKHKKIDNNANKSADKNYLN